MAAPSTAVEICNLALDRLGQRDISSIDSPSTELETICARQFPETVREVLRRYIFNFARKLDEIEASETVTPAFGFTYAFELPEDFIRLLALGDTTINDDTPGALYTLSEGHIFTDITDGDDLKISYIYEATDIIELWDPLFTRLVVLHLAANIAYKLTLKNSLIREIREDAADVALAAAAVAGQEKPPRRIERSRIITARRGGLNPDPTRYP